MSLSESDLIMGDFFVSDSGFGATAWAWVMAKAVQWGTSSAVNHAGVYVGDGKVIEAQPGNQGARYAPVSMYLDAGTFWAGGAFLPGKTREGQRINGHKVAHQATKMLGTPYGYLDIVAIAIAQQKFTSVFGIDPINELNPWDEQPWWVKRLARKDRLICSQLVDEAYRLAGIHLFDDGRLSQLVSPGDLHRLILKEGQDLTP
jgi:cell wall-associated NlpC family hydrolase